MNAFVQVGPCRLAFWESGKLLDQRLAESIHNAKIPSALAKRKDGVEKASLQLSFAPTFFLNTSSFVTKRCKRLFLSLSYINLIIQTIVFVTCN